MKQTYMLLLVLLLCSSWSFAQDAPEEQASSLPVAASSEAPPSAALVVCSSKAGSRSHCDANTSDGVRLVRTTGTESCILGKSWGYDATGVWVSDGCTAEFEVGQAPVAPGTPVQQSVPDRPTIPTIQTWGEFDPGEGFLVGRNDMGELAISAYGLVRYLNQMPGSQTFVDHLGNEHPVDNRNDLFSHRVIIFLKGWVGTRKLIYNVILWTVNTTDQDAIFATLGYQFARRFSLYSGINGTPGTRSLQGSHPYWLGHDRVMADEFFRPYFAFSVWAQGELTPGLWYNYNVANNSSALGVKAVQLDRHMSTGGSMWWMPTTKEFGPKGAYGDWENHDKIATRFGFSTTQSREERFTDSVTGATGNTTVKLADGLNVFDNGALAPGVTVQRLDYNVLSVDAGVKYRGVFLQTEIYHRWLNKFVADGPLPVSEILDKGFYVQGSFYPIKRKLELYGATSQIYGDKKAGFSNSSEYLAGLNFYPANTRNHRLNFQVMDVNHSPVGSTFGYYTAGQHGTTISAAFSVFF